MSDQETPETTEEETQTPETDAEPATEPDATAEPATAEPATAEPAAAEPAATEPPAEPAGSAAPSAQAKPKRSERHVPRSQRRQRPKRVRANTTGARKPIVRGEESHSERGRRQERRGVVVSDAMDKTIVVKVESVRSHQRYKKVIRRSVKFHAHDEQNQAKVGDVVRIVETRPLSKTKNWRLAEIVEAAK
jgi:small subunit ribosomal protein S17